MNPSKVVRSRVRALTDLPNVGPATAADLRLLGYERPADLRGADAVDLYRRLCAKTRSRQDPCVLDTLMSITRFMDGDPPRVWWAYTDERKHLMAAREAGDA